MKSRILSFAATLMIGVGMSLSSHASFQDPSQVQNLPPNTPEKPLYLPYGNEPTVVGTIKVNGQVPAPIRIDTTADPVCGQINPTLKSESIVARQQQLQNAFVYIKEGEALKNYRFEVPESEVTLAHLKCRFSPHVLGLRVGQRLSIVNGDPTQHNTHPTPKLNPEWNQTQPQDVPPLTRTFARQEIMIPFKDNQHPWEKAYVGVLRHPFFAVTDKLGNYEIRGLPPGTYKLVVWHEAFGEQEVELTLAPGETRRVDFIFEASKANAWRVN